jgi:hypothetical protein
MTRDTILMPAAFLALVACTSPTETPDETADAGAVADGTRQPDGICRARETIPAIYEQVMGEVQVVQAEIAEDGTVIRPPIYRRAPVPRIVRPRNSITFEAPCPDTMTPDFVASLQRALAARGHYAGTITGRLDAPTAAAIRDYQSERGLDSAQVSLETARALGLVAVALPAEEGA